VVIDIGAYPVRVGHGVVRTCGNEQTLRVEPAVRECFSGMVTIEGEPSLEPASNIWEVLNPSPVCRHTVAVREPITGTEALQRKIGEGGRRFAYREPRMRTALQQYDIVAEHGEDARHE